jgi:hypothetical protein
MKQGGNPSVSGEPSQDEHLAGMHRGQLTSLTEPLTSIQPLTGIVRLLFHKIDLWVDDPIQRMPIH